MEIEALMLWNIPANPTNGISTILSNLSNKSTSLRPTSLSEKKDIIG